jgi:hypothetical protein
VIASGNRGYAIALLFENPLFIAPKWSYSMDDSEKLLAIKQELERINERLGKLFPSSHPQFDDVFEDLGAAGYYIREAGHCIQAVIKTVQDGGETEVE